MPRWKLTVALLMAFAAMAAAIGLGNWQTRRGDDKALRQAQRDAAAARAPTRLVGLGALTTVAAELPHRVELTGSFVPSGTVYLANRLMNGVAGFFVITPMSIGEGLPWVLVNRGWVARDLADPLLLPLAAVPVGAVQVAGLAVERVPRVLELGDRSAKLGALWQNLDYSMYERVSGRSVAHFVVQQERDTGDGLKREWPRPDAGVDKHRGYAFQWYSLAALIAALTAVFGGKAMRR